METKINDIRKNYPGGFKIYSLLGCVIYIPEKNLLIAGLFLEFKRSDRYVQKGHPTYLPTVDYGDIMLCTS